jgi:hypothetical protein
MKMTVKVGCLTTVFALCLAACGVYGWVSNVVKLCHDDFEHPYKAEILRSISVPLVPVGMVLGWLTFDEEREWGK